MSEPLSYGQLLACAAIVEVHGPPWNRERLAAALRELARQCAPPPSDDGH